MKKLFMILMMAAALMTLASCSQKPGVIKTDVPARPAGQESVIGLTAEPIDVVRVGRSADILERNGLEPALMFSVSL